MPSKNYKSSYRDFLAIDLYAALTQSLVSSLSSELIFKRDVLASINNYFRPDGVSAYKQPDGSYYIRP